MQAIGEVFRVKLFNLNNADHGIQTEVKIISKNDDLFKNSGNKILVGRHHSWVVKIDNSSCLEVTCIDENNEIMAIKHKNFDVKGVQFHPESVLTPKGKIILKTGLILKMKEALNRLINHEKIGEEEAKQVLINISKGIIVQNKLHRS